MKGFRIHSKECSIFKKYSIIKKEQTINDNIIIKL